MRKMSKKAESWAKCKSIKKAQNLELAKIGKLWKKNQNFQVQFF